MDIQLYNGTVTLEYDEKEHAYRYNGEYVPSVTTIIGVIDKPYLIPWALKMAQGYVMERMKDKGLSAYSLSPEISPNQVALWLEEMKKEYRTALKKAGDIGTEVHKWIENHIKAQIDPLGPVSEPILPSTDSATAAIAAFLEWENVNDVKYLISEKKVFSLRHRYAGTLDVGALVNGEKTIVDFKTSNSYSHDYALQTAAYVQAYNEEQPVNDGFTGRLVIMLSKETGMPTPMPLEPKGSQKFSDEFDTFIAAKRVYDWKQTLPKFEYSKRR